MSLDTVTPREAADAPEHTVTAEVIDRAADPGAAGHVDALRTIFGPGLQPAFQIARSVEGDVGAQLIWVEALQLAWEFHLDVLRDGIDPVTWLVKSVLQAIDDRHRHASTEQQAAQLAEVLSGHPEAYPGAWTRLRRWWKAPRVQRQRLHLRDRAPTFDAAGRWDLPVVSTAWLAQAPSEWVDAQLAQGLGRLDESYRIVWAMSGALGWSDEHIARLHGWHVRAVGIRRRRSLAALMYWLSESAAQSRLGGSSELPELGEPPAMADGCASSVQALSDDERHVQYCEACQRWAQARPWLTERIGALVTRSPGSEELATIDAFLASADEQSA